MKKGIAVVFLMLLVSWGQGYAQEPQAVLDAPAHEHENVGETHYQCPMHPAVHQAEPGDCPECGMHLEPIVEVKQ